MGSGLIKKAVERESLKAIEMVELEAESVAPSYRSGIIMACARAKEKLVLKFSA